MNPAEPRHIPRNNSSHLGGDLQDDGAKIRILYIIATLDLAGAERQMVLLATNLDRNSFEVRVASLRRGGPLEMELRAACVPLRVFWKKGKLDFQALFRVYSFIKGFRPDIVHTWLFTSNTLGRIAAVFAGVKGIIVSERCVDIWKGPLHRLLDRLLAKKSSLIIANAQAVRTFCLSEGIAPSKVHVIPNVFDWSHFQPYPKEEARRKLHLSSDLPAFGFVGRLEEQKGLTYLIEAAALLSSELRFVVAVIGSGPLEKELREKAKHSGLSESIRFFGSLDDASSLLTAFDILVLPSLWEGLPNILIEAMASEVPIVATAVGGVPELVQDGYTGLLVKSGDSYALAEGIRKTVAEKETALRLARQAREYVKKRFDLPHIVRAYEDIYREVVRGRM